MKHESCSDHDAAGGARLEILNLQPVRVGMPELCRAGLSETWLFKACGHRHWLALAQAYGLETPEFRGARGETLYPAFIAINLAGDGLGRVRSDDLLRFDVVLARSGQTRFRSHIEVRANGQSIATVIMETVFVHRAIPGANRSATRAIVARPCRLLPPAVAMPLASRSDLWFGKHGFCRSERREIAATIIDPNPHEDFNGADFLYFAAFQAMIDRAEWAWFRQADPLLVTHVRDIAYLGNVELGDRVRAVLCGCRRGDDDIAHWTELHRESDGALISIAFSRRANSIPARGLEPHREA